MITILLSTEDLTKVRLSPSPLWGTVTSFGEELERLRATPPEAVHDDVEEFVRAEKEQFGSLAPEKEQLLETYLKDPEGTFKRVVDELRRYHDLAIAPYWSRIQEHLEGDTLRRGMTLVPCVFAWPHVC